MEARTSFQCWGGGGGTETVTEARDSLLCPPGDPGLVMRPGDQAHIHHMSLESLSQLTHVQDLCYSYQDCLRNAYSM